MKHTLDSEDDSDEPEYHPEADDAGTFWCPSCGAEMYGDATRCPTCGDFVTPGARPSSRTPWWIWAGLVLVAVTLVAGLLASFRH
jgi:predicted RNA-binding Zn-ribbon protein involved in translation (DUF1610 family)